MWDLDMGTVADVQQRAATCQNCQLISELLEKASKRDTDAVTLKFYSCNSASLLLKDLSTGSEKCIRHFIQNGKDAPCGVSVSKNTPNPLLMSTLFRENEG